MALETERDYNRDDGWRLAGLDEVFREERPIDDEFFTILCGSVGAVQELVRAALGDDRVVVREATPQRKIRNAGRRSVTLDCECVLGDGTPVDVEVQNRPTDDDLGRIQYHLSSMRVQHTAPGTAWSGVARPIVIYVCDYDGLRGLGADGASVAVWDNVLQTSDGALHLERAAREAVVVNATWRDDSIKLCRLMRLYTQTHSEEPASSEEFPETCEAINLVKHTEQGRQKMGSLLETRMEALLEEKLEEKKNEIERDMLSRLYLSGDLSADKAARECRMGRDEFIEVARRYALEHPEEARGDGDAGRDER